MTDPNPHHHNIVILPDGVAVPADIRGDKPLVLTMHEAQIIARAALHQGWVEVATPDQDGDVHAYEAPADGFAEAVVEAVSAMDPEQFTKLMLSQMGNPNLMRAMDEQLSRIPPEVLQQAMDQFDAAYREVQPKSTPLREAREED